MVDTVFISIWLTICAYWVYVHARFYTALKRHEPKLYKENSDWSPMKYATGFAYIDFALSGGHNKSENALVISSGNKLVQAYEAKFKLIGYGFFLSSIWFAISMALWGNK